MLTLGAVTQIRVPRAREWHAAPCEVSRRRLATTRSVCVVFL
jgi:hypothetical protein